MKHKVSTAGVRVVVYPLFLRILFADEKSMLCSLNHGLTIPDPCTIHVPTMCQNTIRPNEEHMDSTWLIHGLDLVKHMILSKSIAY